MASLDAGVTDQPQVASRCMDGSVGGVEGNLQKECNHNFLSLKNKTKHVTNVNKGFPMNHCIHYQPGGWFDEYR